MCSALAGSPTVVQCTLGDLANGAIRIITLQTKVASSVPNGTVHHQHGECHVDDAGSGRGEQYRHRTDDRQHASGHLDRQDRPAAHRQPVASDPLHAAVYNRPGCEADDALSCGTGGPSDAQNVVVTDTLPLDPKKMKVIFVSQNCTYN